MHLPDGESMKPHNGDPAAKRFRIRVFIAGIHEPLCYTLPNDEWERVREMFYSVDAGESSNVEKSFVLFETLNPPLNVMVRQKEIQLLHFMADPAVNEVEIPPPDWHLRLFLRGREEPFESFFDSGSQAGEFLVRLDTDPHSVGDVFTWTDSEGEDVTVRVDQIVLAEIDSDALDQGQDRETESDAEDLPL